MLKISIGQIAAGAILAQDIYTGDGRILLSRGTPFRDSFKMRLEAAGIRDVHIEDENGDQTCETAILQDPILALQEVVRIDDVIYEKTRRQAERQIMKTMIRIGSMRPGHLERIMKAVESIMKQLLEQTDMVLSLSKLRSIDDYTYEHSVNVCVISIVIGLEMGLEKDALRELGIGAILHDIGKVGVDERIIKKPGRLSREEFDEVKLHTELGYQILRGNGLSEDVARIALYHHERIDGSGYPHHLDGRAIPLYARIVAVADFYDAITNDRIYRRKMSPENAYREVIRTASNHLDEILVEKFLKHVHMYPNGSGVILNTREKAVVIGQNRLMPESPTVRVFIREARGGGLYGHRCEDVNLSVTPSLNIVDTF